jgi:SAM-dependent methyltransferase
VMGFDLDAAIVKLAERRAADARVDNLRFMVADITKPWLVSQADAVYARFILTHLARPEDMLAQARASLVSGGVIAIEDIDAEGCFWDPPHQAPERLREIYIGVARARSGDPVIGRRLPRLLADAGFDVMETSMVHPYGASGPAKMSYALVAPAIADAAVALGLIGRPNMDKLVEEVAAYAARPDTVMAMPRVFQALARKP